MTSRSLRSPVGLALVASTALTAGLLTSGCNTGSAPAPKACCEQPQIPAGVAPFTVVADEATGPSDGQKVILRVALGRQVKRDEIYPVLHTLYGHAMKRGPFEPIGFIAEVYPSEATARSANDLQLLARISRDQSQMGPTCDNRVGYDFGEQVGRAFAASLGRAQEENMGDTCHVNPPKQKPRFDDGFQHKPSYKLDDDAKSVEVTYPYLEMGKDEYVETLKLTSALTYWIEFVTSLFRKVPDLKAVSFVGVHDDVPVLRISLSRQQFESQFAGLQETIAAHAAVTFQALGTGHASEESAEKEQESYKLETYRHALASLSKPQLTIAPALAKGRIGKGGAKDTPDKPRKGRNKK
jgi:hypothetical protein